MPHITLSPTVQLIVVTILSLGVLVFTATAIAGYLMKPRVGITTTFICICAVTAVCGAFLGSIFITLVSLVICGLSIAQRRDLKQQEREHAEELADSEEDED